MWVIKAINLNRGMCIKVVNSFDQVEKIINKFKEGVDYGFTEKDIEEEEKNQIKSSSPSKINPNEKKEEHKDGKDEFDSADS